MLVGLAVTFGVLALLKPPPMSDQEREMANRMRSFVRALFEPPINEQPATQWTPLLKGGTPLLKGGANSELGGLSCSVCHGTVGEEYDQAIARGELDRGPGGQSLALTKDEMVELMEDWVEQLNHDAGHLLRKAVVCTDCHDRDPRRD